MNCERCKNGPALFHVTAMEKGVPHEAHLCERCMHGVGLGVLEEDTMPKKVSDMKAPKKGAKCPKCGITAVEIRKRNRLGCGYDYEYFPGIERALKDIHGPVTHVEKVPGSAAPAAQPVDPKRLNQLKAELQKAVDKENYERAAQIRDELKKHESHGP